MPTGVRYKDGALEDRRVLLVPAGATAPSGYTSVGSYTDTDGDNKVPYHYVYDLCLEPGTEELDRTPIIAMTVVTGVTTTPATLSMAVAGTAQLTSVVAPATATNTAVTYSTSNAGVATVNASGLVTAVGTGSATITATTTDQSKTDTVAVTVS